MRREKPPRLEGIAEEWSLPTDQQMDQRKEKSEAGLEAGLRAAHVQGMCEGLGSVPGPTARPAHSPRFCRGKHNVDSFQTVLWEGRTAWKRPTGSLCQAVGRACVCGGEGGLRGSTRWKVKSRGCQVF